MSGAKRVLVVDDNPMFTEALAIALEAFGYEVERCHGGRECLEKASRFGPDVIISDYAMDDLDGLTLLNSLRECVETSHIPFVVVTAHATPSLRERLETAGALACHSKFDASENLFRTIQQVLGGRTDGAAPPQATA